MPKPIFIILASILIISACSPAAVPPSATQPAQTEQPTQIPPTATPQPRALTICLGQEPESLYLYGRRTQAMWSVLEGIYDGPIDYVNYTYQPVILTKIPSLADGDAEIEKVKVLMGQDMVDADGNARTLQKGIRYHPADCQTSDCAKVFDGTGEIELDRMVVRFSLKENINWSDGTPLKASDSVFSYSLARQSTSTSSNELIQKTESYTALDGLTTEWKGIPGYRDQNFMTRFWSPLPEHILAGKDPRSLLDDPDAAKKPIGWGPFTITEWLANDHIRLDKNPNYFRQSEGLPKLDTINFRFLASAPQTSLEAVLTGECDVIDESTLLDEQLAAINDLQKAGRLQAQITPASVWEGLYLGINPATYDDGSKVNPDDRPDILGDPRTRQALAMCINRPQLIEELWAGLTTIPQTYQAKNNPTTGTGYPTWDYSPDKAVALLEEIGWKDMDGNPATPRVAVNMQSVYLGTPLQFTYYTTNAVLRKKVTEMIAKDLASCGAQVIPQYQSPEELFKTGPEGNLFGRKFDMTQFSWSPSTMHPCEFYRSDQINSAKNNWVGVNVTGFSNPDYDVACEAAESSLPGEESYQEDQVKAQAFFNQNMPAIPLYQLLRISVTRKDLCGYGMDPTSRSSLWSLEQIDYGPGCK